VSGDLKGYRVYRADGAGPYRIVNETPLEAARYRDEKVVPGTRYSYRVTAVDNSERGNESPFAETSAVTPSVE
jgi:chitodextrinase